MFQSLHICYLRYSVSKAEIDLVGVSLLENLEALLGSTLDGLDHLVSYITHAQIFLL